MVQIIPTNAKAEVMKAPHAIIAAFGFILLPGRSNPMALHRDAVHAARMWAGLAPGGAGARALYP